MEKSFHLTLSLLLVLVLVSLFFSRAHGVEIFSDGFESGDFSAWTGTFGTSATAIASSTAHHGSRCCVENLVDIYKFGGTYKNLGYRSVVYARFYVNVTSIAISNGKDIMCPYLSTGSGGGDYYSRLIALWIKNDSGTCKWELEYKNGGSFFKTVSAITVETDTWVCVEMKCAVSSTVGEARLYIDGNEVITQTGLNNGSTKLYQFDLAYYGWSNGTAKVYNDCVVVADAYIGPECSMIVNVVGGGTVAKIPDQDPYVWGTNVTLTANPTIGWSFNHWSGDASGTVNPVTVNITSDKTVTATFTQNTYALTIMVIGSGSVNLNNSGLYYYGDVVELAAVPAIGWSFDNWSGDLNASANPATILIDDDKMVTATFTQNVYTLTVSTVGNGNVNLNNTGPYHYGDIVELTAVPVTGWSFQGWSGDLLGSVNPSTILIDGNKAVTATFTQNTYTLAITTVGSGSVNLNNSGPYHYGDVIELTAVPATGWSFSVWSGHLSGSANPTTLVIDGNKAVTATFIQSEYTLTVTAIGSGSVVLNDTGPYHIGDAIQLTANPTVGWSFDHWTGDLSGSTNPATIIINGNKAVTATFTQKTYTLSVSIAPLGAGSVNLNNTGPYHYGDVVQLTAVPAVGFSFGYWSGDLSGSINPTTIVINGNKAVTASFTQPAPVGGYSTHISTRNTVQPSAAYAGLVCLFGAVLAALRRKKK